MAVDQTLMFLAVALQSLGKVLYGTFLEGVAVSFFLFISFGLTALVFIVRAGPTPPRTGRAILVGLNISTAVSFICFFIALKHLSPAAVASLELGAALAAAIVLARIRDGLALRRERVVCCAGMIGGCLLLCMAEMRMLSPEEGTAATVLAFGAAGLAGVTSTLSARYAKELSSLEWTSADVLAHRFYATLVIAIVWMGFEELPLSLPEAREIPIIILVGLIGILAPLLLVQIALRRTDTLTVMICCAIQPLLSFLIAIPSPAYDWDAITLLGVVCVSLCLAFDVHFQTRNPAAATR